MNSLLRLVRANRPERDDVIAHGAGELERIGGALLLRSSAPCCVRVRGD